MNYNRIFRQLTVWLFIVQFCKAQDTISRNHPYFLSIGLAYATSKVFGSMTDHILESWNPAGGKLHMNNNGSFAIGVQLQNHLSDYVFIRSGLSYIQKQVQPEYETIVLYQDSLKTGYISVPVIAGANFFPVNNSVFNLGVECGFMFNFRASDKSKTSPASVGLQSHSTVSLCPGVVLTLAASPNQRFLFHYTYIYDLTNAYTETLWLSPFDPNHQYYYRYKTNLFSVEYQFALF